MSASGPSTLNSFNKGISNVGSSLSGLLGLSSSAASGPSTPKVGGKYNSMGGSNAKLMGGSNAKLMGGSNAKLMGGDETSMDEDEAAMGGNYKLMGGELKRGVGSRYLVSGAKAGGSRRLRNMRGRFLSKRKAERITLKKRSEKAATVGTKAQVFHGTAKHTSGGLKRSDLMKTKKGRIVSKRKHAAGKTAIRRLRAAGYKAKKGTFKLFGRN